MSIFNNIWDFLFKNNFEVKFNRNFWTLFALQRTKKSIIAELNDNEYLTEWAINWEHVCGLLMNPIYLCSLEFFSPDNNSDDDDDDDEKSLFFATIQLFNNNSIYLSHISWHVDVLISGEMKIFFTFNR